MQIGIYFHGKWIGVITDIMILNNFLELYKNCIQFVITCVNKKKINYIQVKSTFAMIHFYRHYLKVALIAMQLKTVLISCVYEITF